MQPPSNFLLLIDDSEKDERLEEYFSKFNYKIIYLSSLPHAIDDYRRASAILINWRLIREQSWFIQDLYSRYKIPIIIVSEKKDAEACISTLEDGADDFMTKPLLARELHARIGAIWRRVQRSAKDLEKDKEVYVFANWRLYPASRQLIDDQKNELSLSAGEYDLLYAFVRQPQKVLGREFLLQVTKSSHMNPFDRRIDVQISRLRQKIESNTKSPALIKTIRNGGYFFTAPVKITRENHE